MVAVSEAAVAALAEVTAVGRVADVVAALQALGGVPKEAWGDVHVTVPKSVLVEAVGRAKEAGFEMISDVIGIDYSAYPGYQGKRFVVSYNLHTVAGDERIFLRVEVDDGESVPTITGLWSGANFMERECYDMMGIEFAGHPDLRKLLTPEDLEGHPHRKDFPLGESPTLFNDGRFLDPATFRAGLLGTDPGLTHWKGGARKGVQSEQGRPVPGEADA